MKPRWRRGVVLLQTLVMSVILSMIAVMVMKWVLARYILAARNYRATEAKAHSQGITADQMSRWNFVDFPAFTSIPSYGFMMVDGNKVEYNRGAITSEGNYAFTITSKQE
jgi:hypothetical protein